jgi:hypothetical protein
VGPTVSAALTGLVAGDRKEALNEAFATAP